MIKMWFPQSFLCFLFDSKAAFWGSVDQVIVWGGFGKSKPAQGCQHIQLLAWSLAFTSHIYGIWEYQHEKDSRCLVRGGWDTEVFLLSTALECCVISVDSNDFHWKYIPVSCKIFTLFWSHLKAKLLCIFFVNISLSCFQCLILN